MSHTIILGDVHLGKGLNIGKAGIGSNLNSRIVDQLNLLDWTLDQAIECHADYIIITGDVFEDPKPHPALITLFISWLKKCEAYGVNVVVIMGNHDVVRAGNVMTSPLDIISEVELSNVSVYKDIDSILIDSVAFTLVPFRDRKSFGTSSAAEAISLIRDSLVYELAGLPVTYKKVLIGHLAIEGSIPVGDEIDDLANELFCPLDMFQGYDYVWMGHVHKPQIMKKKNPYIAHIGSMDISNFSETDHKKFIVIMNCVTGEWVTSELPTRPLKKVSITVPKDTEDPTEYVLEELKKVDSWDKSIVKVEVSLAAPELKSVSKSSLEKFLSSQGAYNVTSITESKKVGLVKKDANNTIDTKMDVTSAIKTYSDTYVDVNLRSSFIEVAMDIYATYKAEAKE
jgi:DNA repair exonuclease SbcCD nuclease subunit